MPSRAALELVASPRKRNTSHRDEAAHLDAMRQLPLALSVVTFQRDADWYGITATSVSPLSLDPPTFLLSFDRAANAPLTATTRASFGVNVLAASHCEIADRFRGGAPVRTGAVDWDASWVEAPSGVLLRSDAVVALECESEEVIERHKKAIVIAKIRNVFNANGFGALVYWRGAYNPIGWSDEEIQRAVGLFPATR